MNNTKVEALRNALIEGENSGRAEYSLDKLNKEQKPPTPHTKLNYTAKSHKTYINSKHS
jgi:hypothetical protein